MRDKISDIITDMTLNGASKEELNVAIKLSMIIIDSERSDRN